jgi:hypothetical protein
MKTNIFSLCGILLLVSGFLFLATCDSDTADETIDKNLQGTWKTNGSGNVYSGTLVITSDRITITGYEETQDLIFGDDDQRPFKNITKSTPLKARTEEGNIYIEDAGTELPGISYTYWDDNPPPNSERVEFLCFTFGGRQETMRKEKQ